MNNQPTSWAGAWVADIATALTGGSFSGIFVFVLSYGFDEKISWEDHWFFLGQFGFFALVWGIVAGVINLAIVRVKPWGFVFGLLMSLMVHLVAVAFGVAIALANEGQNSVTADQPNGPFVILAVASIVLAALAAVVAVRVQRREGHAHQRKVEAFNQLR